MNIFRRFLQKFRPFVDKKKEGCRIYHMPKSVKRNRREMQHTARKRNRK